MVFAGAVIALLTLPGPTNTLLLTAGAVNGILRSLPLLAAEAAGYNLGIAVVHLVPAPWLATTFARTAVSIAVALYLCSVAAKLWFSKPTSTPKNVSFRTVLTTTLLNPKVLVVALVLIPPRTTDTFEYQVLFSALVVPIGALWIAFGAMTGTVLHRDRLPVVPKAAALLILGFATMLLAVTWRG